MIRQSLTSWKTITEQLLRILHVMEEDKRDIVIEQIDTLLNKQKHFNHLFMHHLQTENNYLVKRCFH